ncbi:hypothetical protein HNY73_018890 [Argiope bruennichi]|uniref:Peptidase A2 domain-containing protein n=1 Tax=Argiope bruennichi TaxID=94029 RepID=A0A8T0EEZ4_ARGBR|nr:hypothetical protein HNY73_018890 [Argiope bruennichi]
MADSGNSELLVLLAEMKKSMDEMKQGQNEMKAGLEQEMRPGQERLDKEMSSGQERMEEMKAGQERLEKEMLSPERMNSIEDKVASFENKVVSVETKVLEMKESIDKVRENIGINILKMEKSIDKVRENIGINILKMEENIDKVREDIGKESEQKFGKEIESLKKQISHEHEESKATRKDRHPIRAVTAADSDSDFVKQIDDLRREIRRLKERKDGGGTEIRKLICGHLAGRRCPDSQQPHFKVFHISSISGGDNGLYVIRQIGDISCNMVVDTGANVTIIREDLARKLKSKIIWTPPCITLQTVTGDKIHVNGKVNLAIRFGNINYHHTAFVAEITDPCILGLDFLRKYDFKLDFGNSRMNSKFEDITLFGLHAELESSQKIIAKN